MNLFGLIQRVEIAILSTSFILGVSFAQELPRNKQRSAADCTSAAQYGVALDGCEDQRGESSERTFGIQKETVPVAPDLSEPESRNLQNRETPIPVNPSQSRRAEEPVRPHTEFEQIVADTVGRPIPVFGESLFSQPPTTFAPVDQVQVPADYVIGPGDELQVRIWGQLNADLRVRVDRAGQIYIPKVGSVSVAGVHYNQLNDHLTNQISKLFRNFKLNATVGHIRSMQVIVVGQARYPGTYTISSLSSLVNAVLASGGPKPSGSLRDIQVQRDGVTIAHFDFYDLLVKGDKSGDVRLQPGDVVFYPPVGPLVAVAGSVNSSAIFEMKRESTLADLIEAAGGLSTVADEGKLTVERAGGKQERSVLEFALDGQSRTFHLQDGDIVRVMSTVPRFGNAVTLRGNVVNPGRYPWKQGMRITDLIPDAQTLLTRPYWLDRAVMVSQGSTEYPIPKSKQKFRSGELGQSSTEYSNAKAESRFENDLKLGDLRPSELKDTDLRPALGEDDDARLLNQRSKRTTLRSQNPLAKDTLTEDLHRASPEINWSYAIIQRVNPVDLSTKLIPFDLGKAVLEKDSGSNLELQPDDIITVFSQTDIEVPQQRRDRYVKLEGEVTRPGVYKVNEGETLRELIQRAGGLTPKAYIYGTQLTRESARLEQQKSLDELARSLEVEIRQSTVASTAHSADDVQTLSAQQGAQNALISQIRNTRATGRVVLVLAPSAQTLEEFPALELEDNDRIVVPHTSSTVSVVGMVYNPGSFLFNRNRRVGDYLKLAGRGRPNADMHHAFILRADGTVVPSTAVNGLFSGDKFASVRLHPGDQIVVPNKIQTGNFVRGLRDWTQISSQLALTGAALAVIH